MPDVAMPRLSDSMEEGTILKWLKSDGDEVSKGEELVEIETDKANMTYEADEAGTLEIVASEGDTLAVGETIARIGEGGGPEDSGEQEEEEPEPEEEEEEDEGEPEADADEDDEEPAPKESSDNGRVKASPIARRMAEERGLDLADIEGTGPGGRIVKADIEKAGGGEAEEQPAPEEPKEEEPRKPARDGEAGRGDVEHVELNRLQRTVARRMAESKATAADCV
ncbi:MAG: E3 binding domain-containing protein, partial [Microbacteriaceae bacterium]|nr:E3 binding domain-containing protein [Microbacteriaceae bacterium]